MIAIMSEEIATLFDQTETRALHAGSVVFHAGDPVRRLYLVTEGLVELVRMTASGAPVVLQRAGAGQVLAEASVYSASYHCDAYARQQATLRGVSVAQFRARLAATPALAEIWAAHLAHAVQAARFRAELRTLRTVGERLDAWLASGRALPPKGAWQDVAAELGVTREALYRHLATRPDRIGTPED